MITLFFRIFWGAIVEFKNKKVSKQYRNAVFRVGLIFVSCKRTVSDLTKKLDLFFI